MESKFDFSESKEQQSPSVKKNRLTAQLKYLSQLLRIGRDTDYAATLEAVRADIPFKGATAWVLICSIFIASIGLNTNSTAVVIGAMLIAPLMGPVLGIGVSLAINDLNMLKQAVPNFLVMVVLSVTTATLFFLLFPLQQESSELLARTQPDIRDVFIAFFWWCGTCHCTYQKGNYCFCDFWGCYCNGTYASFMYYWLRNCCGQSEIRTWSVVFIFLLMQRLLHLPLFW